MDETLPTTEDCSTPTTDENCDHYECGIWGIGFEQAGGGAVEVAPNAADGAVVAGIFSGGVSIGGKSESALDGFDVFVASFDSGGAVEWLMKLGGTGSEFVTALTTASSGEIYLAVYTTGTVDFGDGAHPPGTSLIHLTSTGGFVSSRSMGNNFVYGLFVDAAGKVYGVGSLAEQLDLGAGPLSPSGEDVLVVKLEPDLTLGSGWGHKFGGAGTDTGVAITGDSVSNVYFVGSIQQSVSFDGNPANADAAGDAFIAKLNSAGTCVGLQSFGANGSPELATGVTVDAAGGATVLGTFKSSFNLETAPLSATADSLFLARFKFSNTFHVDWAKGFNNFGFVPNVVGHAPHLSIDGAGNTVFTANAVGVVDLGGASVAGVAKGLPSVVKFNSKGEHLWHRTLGGAEGGEAFASSANATGEVFAVGTTDSPSLDIGGDPVSAGQDYSYTVKFGK